MGESTTEVHPDLFSFCSYAGCDKILDDVPQRVVDGQRKVPTQAKGMCWKHYMKSYRQSSKKHTIVCAVCGEKAQVFNEMQVVCGSACQSRLAGKLGNQANIVKAATNRSPLNQAIDDWDYDGMVAALLEYVTVGGKFSCWHWPKLNENGYPVNGLHRRVCEVKYGRPLGEQPAHHECSNKSCVRPDHLVPVSHAANIAEMLARNSMLKYIETLKARVHHYNPHDPVLNRIEFR